MPDVRRRHRDVFRETAVAIHPDDFCERTYVRVAGAAKQASPVDNVSFSRDAVSLANVGDEGSDFDDIAGEFVADNERRPASSACPRIPIVYMNVSAADSGSANFDQNLIISDLRLGNILQLESRTGRFFYESFHEEKLI
jgi:hypothetical protein